MPQTLYIHNVAEVVIEPAFPLQAVNQWARTIVIRDLDGNLTEIKAIGQTMAAVGVREIHPKEEDAPC